MKNLLKLAGTQKLSKDELQKVNGGYDTPCGGTPFIPQPHIQNELKCQHYGYDWHIGACYACL